MASRQPPPRVAFADAALPDDAPPPRRFRLNRRGWAAIIVGVLALIGGVYVYIDNSYVPPKGNILYGICRVYIERHLQFPNTMRLIQFRQEIPDKSKGGIKAGASYEITFYAIDGFGQRPNNTVRCEFKGEPELQDTPWKGYRLVRVTVNNKSSHGWADVYYPADKKNPPAPDDNSDALEEFHKIVPIIHRYPPDLTLPILRLDSTPIENLQDLNAGS